MKEIITNTHNKKSNAMIKVGKFLNRHGVTVATVLVMVLMVSSIFFAEEAPKPVSTADALWTTITDIVKVWVTRLGAVIIFVGGIMFALGWKSDDAEQKSRGISTIIAGAMVTAIAAAVSTFFA